MKNHMGLLMIEPTGSTSAEPVIDGYTRRMAAALNAEPPPTMLCRGVHFCTGRLCGAVSDNAEHVVAGLETNSLAVHYLAYHRPEVPDLELNKIGAMLPAIEADPTVEQLTGRPRPDGLRPTRKVWR